MEYLLHYVGVGRLIIITGSLDLTYCTSLFILIYLSEHYLKLFNVKRQSFMWKLI
jgi:hypothetical protein